MLRWYFMIKSYCVWMETGGTCSSDNYFAVVWNKLMVVWIFIKLNITHFNTEMIHLNIMICNGTCRINTIELGMSMSTSMKELVSKLYIKTFKRYHNLFWIQNIYTNLSKLIESSKIILSCLFFDLILCNFICIFKFKKISMHIIWHPPELHELFESE